MAHAPMHFLPGNVAPLILEAAFQNRDHARYRTTGQGGDEGRDRNLLDGIPRDGPSRTDRPELTDIRSPPSPMHRHAIRSEDAGQ